MRAYYRNTLSEFVKASVSEVAFALVDQNGNFGFPQIEREVVEAWKDEVLLLQNQLVELSNQFAGSSRWGVLLEFPIPRRQRRIDAVVLAGQLIFVLEFKSGASDIFAAGKRQVEDYALDLAYFHRPSHNRVIVPILVAPDLRLQMPQYVEGNIRSVGTVSPHQLASLLLSIVQIESAVKEEQISLEQWDDGVYEPVPSVIEAAVSLYEGMSVREIARSHAGEVNLVGVTEFLLAAVSRAQARQEKIICFITGIPGAGKTLAGLNLVHSREINADGRPASVFMSGNGPLVEILREALAIDSARRTGTGLGRARSEVKTFVQNIHHFVKDNLERPEDQTSYEHAIVFDEAQRAWNAEQNRKKYKKRVAAWHVSEPEMVLKVMDRHSDWAAVIALVGGGQEIHDGEAGLGEWGRALGNYPHWRVLVSPDALQGGESVGGASLFGSAPVRNEVIEESTLHLNVCLRSHQAVDLAKWVNSVLKGDDRSASLISDKFEQFPIVLTRDLGKAKEWLLRNARGERRCGLVASSGASRLRAFGIETSMAIREAYSYPHWFLKPRGDIRSSYQLETVATEFEIQGLELDLAGLCWGGDLVWDRLSKSWHPLQLAGNKWKDVKESRAIYIQNKYRVLMTRAREGLVIWVPEGDGSDPTRNIDVMNTTAEYLIRCGVVPFA